MFLANKRLSASSPDSSPGSSSGSSRRRDHDVSPQPALLKESLEKMASRQPQLTISRHDEHIKGSLTSMFLCQTWKYTAEELKWPFNVFIA